MSLGISVFDAGIDNDIHQGSCTSECSAPKSMIKNIRWGTHDSVNELDDGELIVGGPTRSLEECGDGCTQCHEYWNSNDPFTIEAMCMDEREMKYGNKCNNNKKWNADNCNEEGYCLKSYPFGDPDKMRSPEAMCRTAPESHIEGPFGWASRPCKNEKAGLCGYGCDAGEVCTYSWLQEDPLKWKAASAICRCKPQ